MSKRIAKVISTELLDNKDAKWINLVKITYEDENGQVRTWEAMRRPTRPKASAVDAVQMMVVLHRPETGPELLLEKQFRAPAGKIVIEFPAGLVDEGETPEQAALRELKEETGYIGEVVPDRGGTRPILFSSPASSSSSTFLIHLKVDPDKEENRDPKPQLEDGEFIECFWVPLNNLYAECRKLEAQGFAIDGKVGVFAEGLEMSKIWSA
ncbi:putative ADP-ribose pyrophosphatase [Hypoxylon trugodes]|uniref:putative ADP-ribose pyrophosphatase n=1 Tax=Hypoxylon trugodes TaxID=326681 RepID=UPI00219832A2|nr:putative ADP-ribose pyrophosphatase [Hypoxylon trugodes]KAI1392438.1 putative ADP-ribose pyrophosphatase [Hypoxylon trugodes]